MNLRGILLLLILIYPFFLFAGNSKLYYRISISNPADSTIPENNILIPVDSITTIPGNNFTIPVDTVSLIRTQPVDFGLPTDSIKLIRTEPVLPEDSVKLIRTEPPVIGNDSINALQPVPLISPEDSTGVLKVEIQNPADSLKRIELKRDSVTIRYEFRSVYADSVEQGNPNFLPRNVLMIKWITDQKRDTVIRYKNIVGFHAFYGTYNYGIGGGMFIRLSNDADFIANINFNYVIDRRTEGDLDSNGTLRDLERKSRLFTITFNAGLEKYFMQNRIDWKIKPILLFGFAPAIVLAAPYDVSFFKSIFKSQLSFGLGVFAALGFDWQAFKKVGINLTARYAFIPVLGRDIYYYSGFKVKNLGGIYVNLGVTLLKEYFSKN